MKKAIVTLVTLMWILLFVPLVSAHAIEKGPVIKSTDTYDIQFSAEPKFPVTGKDIHMDFIIKDKEGNLLSGLSIEIELHKEGKAITLDLDEEEKGHYSVSYNFDKAGDYEIHAVIDDNELETEFDLEIDSFGLSGLLRTGVIVLLLLILLGLMYKDCRRQKNG